MKQAIQLTILTVCLVLCLSSLQLLLFPRAVLFGDTRRILAEETGFISRADSGSRLQSIQSLVFHSMIMPEIKSFDPYWNWLKWKIMRVQLSGIGSGTTWGLAAIPLWCALLGLGIWGLITVQGQGPTRLVLLGTILSQLAFHTFYGREPFLYSLHVGPILLVLAAFAALTPLRRVSLVLATGLLLLVAINNGTQFGKAIDFFHLHRPQIHRLQSETELPVSERQPDFHEKISLSADVAGTWMNGYLGPGGSFSPSENSFGLSIWAVNRDDIIATSDTFWPPGASQEVSWERCGTLPVAKTAVHYFNTKVEVTKPQTWSLSIDQMGNFITRLVLAVRGLDLPEVGSILWTGIPNDYWSIIDGY